MTQPDEEDCNTKTVCQTFGCGGCGLAPENDGEIEEVEEGELK